MVTALEALARLVGSCKGRPRFSGLPSALTAFVFARHYGPWIEHASSVVLFGTLFSVVTLTVVMWLVQTGALPRLTLW